MFARTHAYVAVVALSVAGMAQQDVADREFGERAELHAAEPAVGTRVPDLVLMSLEGRPVAMTSLRGSIVVAIRAGYTSQPFRDAAAGLKKLQENYADSLDVTFLVVVEQEPGAGQPPFEAIAQPKTLAERIALAERMRDEVDFHLSTYADGMSDASRSLFADQPSSALVIDREGRIADKLPRPDAEPLQRAIERVLRNEKPMLWPDGKPLPFEERDTALRRAQLAGDAFLRLHWRNAEAAAKPDESATPIERARLSISRAKLFCGRTAAERQKAIAAVYAAIETAWRDDPPRLLAARVELAELRALLRDPTPWAELEQGPRDDYHELARKWVAHRHAPLETLIADFDEAARERVRLELDAHKTPGTNVIGSRLSVVRMQFVKGTAYVHAGAERIGLEPGDEVYVMPVTNGVRQPPTDGERTVLVAQVFMVSTQYKAVLLEVSER